MIQEAYCSFEVSKLLKEKGFNDPLRCWYDSFQDFHEEGVRMRNTDCLPPTIMCPTHQMAMKWLREEKNILLYVYPVINLPVKDDYTLFHWRWDGKKKIHAAPHFGDKHNNYESYEEAVEAAIKYCLENLI